MMNIAELNIKRLKLSDVKPHPDNPRLHSKEQIEKLADSIKQHGFAKGSMVVQESTSYLVAGHGVYEALTLLDYEEADFIVVDMTDSEAKVFLIRDNKLGDDSVWDYQALDELMVELDSLDIDLEETGFDLEEIAGIRSYASEFQPVSEDTQPRLDQKKPIKCPECSYEFVLY